MLVVRLVTTNDVDSLLQLAQQAGGKLTNLPHDAEIIAAKVQSSIDSLAKIIQRPGNEYYFFVLEDITKQQVVGCAAIKAAVGVTEPWYAYRLTKIKQISEELNYQHTLQLLELVNDFEGMSEICSLYILPQYRQKNLAKLLSWSRLLFIANFPERFAKRVFADVRGVTDKKGDSLFWQHVGNKFCPLSFMEAYKRHSMGEQQFIADLMPKLPIYIDLLPPDIREVIGKAHEEAEPAMHMLQQQGFHFEEYVNIFDAGPMVNAFADSIVAINQSEIVTASDTCENTSTMRIITNTDIQFRAILSDSQKITEPELELLQIKTNDKIRQLVLEA
jgi:arginine N-succinyltransferase